MGRSKLANTQNLGFLHRTSLSYHVANTLKSTIYDLILLYDLATTPGPLFQKIIYDNQIRSGLQEVVGSFSENLTAITERIGTLSEGYRKYSCESFQNMIQNALKTPRNSCRGLFFTGKHNLCPVQVLHFGVHNAIRVPVMFRVY